MKKLLLLIVGSALSFMAISQVPKYDTGRVNINSVTAPFTADGTLNFLTTGLPGYYVPKGLGTATIFCGSLWVGGLDAGSNLHLAAQTYHQNGTDFWPGPMMDSINYSTHEDTVWDHVWVIYKSTIDSFREGKFGTNIPASIANWPGNGNIALGEMGNLAPFVDSNHNGYYDPAGGDYPLIRGDMALYAIFNDDRGPAHTESGAQKLGIEVHLMVYQFNSTDTAVYQTTYMHYDIFNRSKNNYNNVYLGNWIDMDIGNGGDNYIGCDSANSYWYTFDGHDFNPNATGEFAGEVGFGNTPAAQALAYMCDTMTHFMYYNNDFTVQGNPTTADWYYGYLKNIWGDNSHTTYGGTGYGGVTPTNFVYSGNPYTNTGWTEISAGNVSGDRRGMSSVGPFTLNSDSRKSLDVALVFAIPPVAGTGNTYSVAMLPDYIDEVRNFYNTQNYGCDDVLTGVSEIKTASNTPHISVYPNPANTEFYVQFANINGRTNVTLYNIMGQQVFSRMVEPQKSFVIPVTNLSPGLYLLKAQMEDGTVITEKVEVVR